MIENYMGRDMPGKARLVMGIGSGKTESLIAYWHHMQTPAEGEDMVEGNAVGAFVPPSEADLQRRLASLHERVVEPLPEDIESLSDSSQFLDEKNEESAAESQEVTPQEGESSPASRLEKGKYPYLQGGPLVAMDALLRYHFDLPFHVRDEWMDRMREFSVVLFCGFGKESPSRKRRTRPRYNFTLRPRSRSEHFFIRHRREEWADVLGSFNSDYVRTRDEHLREMTSSMLHPLQEPTRDLVQTYFTVHTTCTIMVDNLGAARDPDAALRSLLRDATSLSASEEDDGRMTLLIMAPAASQPLGNDPARPRLAILELPNDGPADPRQPNQNGESTTLLRELRNALEACK
ncbi:MULTISPECIES: hypothetical protein [unclassified Streptomyces]|uniref:hypothetical protein n=1 Tax=unclassified Streptomyces TaxID=2593676 RepID=UPI003328C1F5